MKQALRKTLESCSNGIPHAVRHALHRGDDAYIAFCVSHTDEKGKDLKRKGEGALQGKVLLIARVLYVFSRKDCEDVGGRGRQLRALLEANPSSQALHPVQLKNSSAVRFKYDQFMALDMNRLKIIGDPGLTIPAEPPCKRVAGWVYDETVIRAWIEDNLGGLP